MVTDVADPETPAVDWAAFESAIPFIRDLDITGLLDARVKEGYSDAAVRNWANIKQDKVCVTHVLDWAAMNQLVVDSPGIVRVPIGDDDITFMFDQQWMSLIRALIERAKALAVIMDGSERYEPDLTSADFDLLVTAAPYFDEFPTKRLVELGIEEQGWPAEIMIDQYGDILPFHINHPALHAVEIALWNGGDLADGKCSFGKTGTRWFIFNPGDWEPVIRAAIAWHDRHAQRG